MIFKRTVSSLIQVKFILMWGRNLTLPHWVRSSPNHWFWNTFPYCFYLLSALYPELLYLFWSIYEQYLCYFLSLICEWLLVLVPYCSHYWILEVHFSIWESMYLLHYFSTSFLTILTPLFFQMNFRILLTSSKQNKSKQTNSLEFLLGLCLKLEINLGIIVVFANLNLPIQEHGMSLHLLKYFFS